MPVAILLIDSSISVYNGEGGSEEKLMRSKNACKMGLEFLRIVERFIKRTCY